MSAVRYRIVILLLTGAIFASLPGCDDTSSQSGEQSQIQRNTNIRIGDLSAEQALAYSDKLKARGIHDDMVHLLRFVHYYKLGQRNPALVALELVKEQTAKAIVASVKEQRSLEDQDSTIDLDEGLELRTEMVSDCEKEVNSGRFKPLTGKQFCVAWDSGVLDLLPMPGELLTVSARLLARKALLRLPRERLRSVPRLASIMARTEAKRVVVRQALARHVAIEDELMKQLLDFQWNVTVDLSDHDQ